jgi:hypothetical protein
LTPLDDGGWSFDDGAAPFTAKIDPSGRVSFRDRSRPVGSPLDEGIRFAGPADWEKRAAQGVPHGAEKLAFLRWTESHRYELSVAAASENLGDAERRLRNELDLLWGDSERDAKARRRALFERWDECLEGPLPIDGPPDPRQAAGSRARLAIELFVRERVPADSPDAFGADELAELNAARRSVAPFDPYGSKGVAAPSNAPPRP